MSHIVIVGGGAALAQPVIRHYLNRGDQVTAVCRKTRPGIEHESLNVLGTCAELHRTSSRIDLLVTMTGTSKNARLIDMTVPELREVIDSCLGSVFEALCLGLPLLKDGGNVVVVGSIVGSTGGYGCANYAAAKAGLVGLVRAAANEHASRNICINLLELGYINAGMGARLDPKVKERILPIIPLKRFGTEEDVVAAIDYLGQVRYVTGGILTLAGGLR